LAGPGRAPASSTSRHYQQTSRATGAGTSTPAKSRRHARRSRLQEQGQPQETTGQDQRDEMDAVVSAREGGRVKGRSRGMEVGDGGDGGRSVFGR